MVTLFAKKKGGLFKKTVILLVSSSHWKLWQLAIKLVPIKMEPTEMRPRHVIEIKMKHEIQ